MLSANLMMKLARVSLKQARKGECESLVEYLRVHLLSHVYVLLVNNQEAREGGDSENRTGILANHKTLHTLDESPPQS